MGELRTRVQAATASGGLQPRVWIYTNYHCNRECSYCLADSSPRGAPREFGRVRIVRAATRAAELGFTELGITGGEPFLLPYLPEVIDEVANVLPVLVLTNGTVLGRRRLARLGPLADRPVRIQISLDHPDPVRNDAARGPDGFRRAVRGIAALVDLGVTVRIATTLVPDEVDPADVRRLCALHRALGVPDHEHVIRPVIRRGRATRTGIGRCVGFDDLDPELTLTADGAFWSPFGPTVLDGVVDTELLLTRTTDPLDVPLSRMLDLVEGRPAGDDARTGIR